MADSGLSREMGFDVERLGFESDPPAATDYLWTWEYQRAVLAQVAAGIAAPRLIFVQHPPVYTAGRSTKDFERPFDGTPVIDVDRGGKITWHGPGQLVGYPIVKLPGRVGVVDYVRRVEQAIIDYLAELGLPSGRVPERTGVWLPADDRRPERKICAIGVRVSRRTTMHGFALNVHNSTTRFDNIVPCGIDDAGVTSILGELGTAPSLAETIDGLLPHLLRLLTFEPFTPTDTLETEPLRMIL